MTRRSKILIVFAFLTSQQAFAHVKWFQGERPPLELAAFFQPLPLAFSGGVTLVVLALWFWQRTRTGKGFLPGAEFFNATIDRRKGLYGFIPAILGIHIAVPLLVAGVTGHLFSTDNELNGAWRPILGLLETGIALSLFYGGFARVSAVLLAWLWIVGVLIFGVEAMFDNALMLGFAGFFWLAGRGPISVDRLLFPRLEPSAISMEKAVPVLRIGLGLGLVAAALSEKLANPRLASMFLEQYPLNFTSSLGIPIPDNIFVLCAGSVELLVGLCLIFGVFTREIIVIAWLPINLTLTIFDWSELVGHLPIYGAMALLFVWNSSKANLDLWVKGLREGPLGISQPSKDKALH
jgi:uncharacterized membrane protein YphA (DoxX/SURF4 family)